MRAAPIHVVGRAGITKVIGTLCDCKNTPRKERMKGVEVRDATYMLGEGGGVENFKN